MANVAGMIDNKYRTMSQGAPAAPKITYGQTVGTATPTFGKSGQFGVVAPGGSSTVGGFTATNAGGMAVIRPTSSPYGMMDLLRTQGYTPEQAAQAVNAASGATSADAGAALDRVKAQVLPADSAADQALRRAQANLTGVQASVLPGVSASENALRGAQTFATRRQTESDYDPIGSLYAAPASGAAGSTYYDYIRNRYLPRPIVTQGMP